MKAIVHVKPIPTAKVNHYIVGEYEIRARNHLEFMELIAPVYPPGTTFIFR